MPRTGRALILPALALLSQVCAGFDLTGYHTAVIESGDAAQRWNGVPVETGQIIVSEHTGATSLFLSLTTREFEPFLHTGVIVVEQGEPFVYESMAAILPLPWSKPNKHIAGGVQRVRLERFVKRGGIIALYAPRAGVDPDRLAAFVRDKRVFPFDGQYDAHDASKYYCVEFVARALEAGGAQPIAASPLTANASVQVALRWLGIGGPDMLMAGALIAGQRRVALLSRGLTEFQIGRYFELKRELHRRFTADQRLGNVLFWRDQRLHLRPAVEEYFESGILTPEDPARVADRVFKGV
jgi:hypothetical protein